LSSHFHWQVRDGHTTIYNNGRSNNKRELPLKHPRQHRLVTAAFADHQSKSATLSAANAVQDSLAVPNYDRIECSSLPEEALKLGRNIQNKTRMSENNSILSPSSSNFRFTRNLK